ncbi:flavin mononucleotide-binding protein [Arenibacter aquaticus]|uniref:Flavin mononucleotide-binding protein n=1 Tax=Arenibacter aquaticus TaxID=2489054 RepID=A0A430K834_9FLAO|nr:pyridoxamine 5'-phosphate oxidase family protein [Arenibacter aquaticus]RTE55225.1 flavin mononucleotide-binding protein [Arenibacter aquaticus]
MFKDLNTEACKHLLDANYIGRIGYISKNNADIIPITYYYDADQHSIISYSGEGFKIDAMRKNESVSFQVDEIESVNQWKSVLLYGTFEELSGSDAKRLLHKFSEGVKKNISKKENASPKFIGEFSSKLSAIGSPVVYRINISGMTGKQRI